MTALRPRLIVAAALAAILAPTTRAAPPKGGAWTIGRPVAAAPAPIASSPVNPVASAQRTAPQAPSTAPASAPVTSGVAVDPGLSPVLQELEVIGRPPGPAMWKVAKGQSEVVIIGGLSPLPHTLDWPRRRVEKALQGATVLLTPPATEVNPFEAAKLLVLSGALHLPGAAALDAKLTPPVRAKFLQAAQIARVDPKRYAKWRPAAAGFLLIEDFRRAAGLSSAKPATTLERMARADGVPVRHLAKLSVSPALDAVIHLPADGQLACLEAAADDVLRESGHARTAADAWARGDVQGARANWSDAYLERCILQQSKVQVVLERGTAEATRSLNDALSKPGRTVALVDLHFLLRADGLLDRLRAGGATVTVPES